MMSLKSIRDLLKEYRDKCCDENTSKDEISKVMRSFRFRLIDDGTVRVFNFLWEENNILFVTYVTNDQPNAVHAHEWTFPYLSNHNDQTNNDENYQRAMAGI